MKNKLLWIGLLGTCIIGGVVGYAHAQLPCVGCGGSSTAAVTTDKMEESFVKSPVVKAPPSAAAHHVK